MLYELLKYIDCFGTKFNFYTEKNRKFYTPLGGIFSLLAFFFSVIVFIFLNVEDFLHTAPISSTSVMTGKYSNITFGNEQTVNLEGKKIFLLKKKNRKYLK